MEEHESVHWQVYISLIIVGSWERALPGLSSVQVNVHIFMD